MNCKRIFWASILMVSVSGCAHAASVDRFRFSDLDKYPVSGTPDQQYQQLIQHRQQYVLAHFPDRFLRGQRDCQLNKCGCTL